jgi:IclR family transcriptional regulator, acetate operon repressor
MRVGHAPLTHDVDMIMQSGARRRRERPLIESVNDTLDGRLDLEPARRTRHRRHRRPRRPAPARRHRSDTAVTCSSAVGAGIGSRPARVPSDVTGPSVASKIFAVLDTFEDASSSLRLTEIAARTGIPMPTALRLVRELVSWGGLERQGDGSYRVGSRLWTLGAGAPCVRRIRRAAAPSLQALFAGTGQEVHLAVLDGTEALVLGAVGRHTEAHDGDRLPLHASAVGKVLLAHAPPSVLDAVQLRGLTRLTPYTVDAPGRLAGQLRRVRTIGIASAYEEIRLGRASIAAAVLDQAGAVVAAIGLTVATPADPSRYLRDLKRAAGQVTFAG